MKNKFLLIFFLFTFKAIGDDCDCCNCLNFCENEENDTLDNKKNILDEKKDILDNEYLSYFKFEEYKNNPEVNEEIENDTIDIFLCIDDAFVYPCLVTIKSIIDNSEHKNLLSFFILIPEKFESTKHIEKFKEKEKCKIQIISMGDKYEKLSTGRRWATPAYYRFSIPWITKKKKAIYLDSDLLIRKDIKNLFDIDLEEYCYAAVVDGSANENHILPNLEGNITTLGRGGSDTTAIALAAALGTHRCEIYKDVDGVYSEDPNTHSDAIKFDHISYDKMLYMANNGAQVLHNKCVALAKDYNVEIMVRSTFKDNCMGTIIS